MKKTPAIRIVGRNAGTGKFIPVDLARRQPKTAIVEKIKVAKQPPKKP
jgi:hypothetical protein